MSCEFEDNCKGRIVIENMKEDLEEVKEGMLRNFTELYKKSDESVTATTKLGEKVNTKLWVLLSGMVISIAVVVITSVL